MLQDQTDTLIDLRAKHQVLEEDFLDKSNVYDKAMESLVLLRKNHDLKMTKNDSDINDLSQTLVFTQNDHTELTSKNNQLKTEIDSHNLELEMLRAQRDLYLSKIQQTESTIEDVEESYRKEASELEVTIQTTQDQIDE